MHGEALLAEELDKPLRTAISVEAAGLVELVYPGLSELSIPGTFNGAPTDEVRARLEGVWPDFLASLLDTLRADRAVAWSKDEPGRTWNDESPLYARWSTRSKNSWSARRFIGDDTRRRDTLQQRLWFSGAYSPRRDVPKAARRLCWRLPSINCATARRVCAFRGSDGNPIRWAAPIRPTSRFRF